VLAGWLLGAAWAGAVMVVGSWWDSIHRPVPAGRLPAAEWADQVRTTANE
jgi:hypothetical protein